MKLSAGRRRDLLDVVELIKVGVDVKSAREYLKLHADDLVPRFEELVNEALSE